ncbi:hypothetical protein GBA52_022173 [Prunus armeniaca]|nr:hypothetical protein GBA52_022173 [Prunus armeniaca]
MIVLAEGNIHIKFLAFHVFLLLSFKAKAKCKTGCNFALASYHVWEGANLTYISNIFGQQVPEILQYNRQVVRDYNGTRIKVPFSCDCLNGDFLGHTFTYITQHGDTYNTIAENAFANLTTVEWLSRVNVYAPTQIPDEVPINVTVNCSCGNRHVSKDYGLFETYPLRPGEDLSFVAVETGVPAGLLVTYNRGSNFSSGNGLVFVPARAGISGGAIAGICVGGVSAALILALLLYAWHYKRKVVEAPFLSAASEDRYIQHVHGEKDNASAYKVSNFLASF